MAYKVKLNVFEGPLDLLLFLIKKERIDVYDIPVSRITEQYLAYLEVMELLDLNIAGEFLVMAATLIHIKSKMLLPPEEDREDAEGSEDPREELVRKLVEYKKYKEASYQMRAVLDKSRDVFFRKGGGGKEKSFADREGECFEAGLFELISAFRKVLKNIPKKKFHEVIKDRFTVADKMHSIYHLLAGKPRIYFSALFGKAENRDEVIATFLAVLELIRLREIIIVQNSFFGGIEIIRDPGVVKDSAGAGNTAGGHGSGEPERDGELSKS
ncbi:MAG: segregation/condensation protein A [Candidatus Omnitrophica bacterium]|nr:segregation/condensation protein A [Candidatus Omnitrophota bacterium]